MNNKPVAWMGIRRHGETRVSLEKLDKDDIPLYTHPVKEYKEPSVKEIDELWIDVVNNRPANDKRPIQWHFARAILRKAQEK